ncbi:hypothetical protein [Aggregatibacter kilianii]|uniref:hypothetical protein n=1 Tax=Aggregatibacter kilianii TaxID=2025884 RepID=UPI0028D76A9D|nr:hypothetical protein [Aggregatibacter kilianii]
MDANILDNIVEHIPFYLTQDKDAKEGFVKNLEKFPNNINYYTSYYPNDELQGDGWEGLDIVDVVTSRKRSVKGIILSNSCDISTENKRELPPNILFAPIVELEVYRNRLIKAGIAENQINSKIEAIKKQKVTSLFYLPTMGNFPESIVIFDDVRSLPMHYFQGKKSSQIIKKVFTLSQFGFYLFLFKISIHFCRFHEKVLRDTPPVQS